MTELQPHIDWSFTDQVHDDAGGAGITWKCPDCRQSLTYAQGAWWSLDCGCAGRNWGLSVSIDHEDPCSAPDDEPLEPEGPSDQEIEEWADAATEVPLEEMDPEVHGWRRCFTKEEFGASIRAALVRWGTPQPPAAGEVAAALIELRSTVMGLGQMGMYVAAQRVERAADLLRRHHPQPVPVSERLPGPEDCDAEGRCWMFDPCDRGWWCYREALPSDGDPEPFTHWLPHWALPVPAIAAELEAQ